MHVQCVCSVSVCGEMGWSKAYFNICSAIAPQLEGMIPGQGSFLCGVDMLYQCLCLSAMVSFNSSKTCLSGGLEMLDCSRCECVCMSAL